MRHRSIIFFLASTALCTLAATHRFGDSAHTMGVLKPGGGNARHPVVLDKERGAYTVIATAQVLPPFHGNVRVVLEGEPGLSASFHNSEPAVPLPFHQRPKFVKDTYYDLRPGDRIALWARLTRSSARGDKLTGSGDAPLQRGGVPDCGQCPGGIGGERKGGKPGGAALVFYDTKDGREQLRMPIRFVAKGGESHGRR